MKPHFITLREGDRPRYETRAAAEQAARELATPEDKPFVVYAAVAETYFQEVQLKPVGPVMRGAEAVGD